MNPTILFQNIFRKATEVLMTSAAGDSDSSVVNSSYPITRLSNDQTVNYCKSTTTSGTVYISVSRNNLIINYNAEVNTNNWTTTSGSGSACVFERNTTTPLRDNADFKLDTTVSGATQYEIKSNYFDLKDSKQYQLNFRGKADATRLLDVYLKDRAGNILDSTTITFTTTATTHTWDTNTVSEDYTDCYISFMPQGVSTFYLDDIYFARVDSIDTLVMLEGHNLHGTNITVYSSPYLDGTYTTLISSFTPNNDLTIHKQATSGQQTMYYIIKIENTTQAVKIPQIALGDRWVLDKNVLDGYDQFSTTPTWAVSKSETGQATRTLKYKKQVVNATYTYMLTNEVTKYLDLKDTAENYPIYWCFDYTTNPEFTYLCMCDKSMFTAPTYLNYRNINIKLMEV